MDAVAQYAEASERNAHLRPWLALTLFAARLLPAVLRHPGMALRASSGRSRRL